MAGYITGEGIRALREGRGMTQRQLADMVGVTDKAVSKWETGKGLPDIALLEPLSRALGVSLAELLAGEAVANSNVSANMKRSKFFVCPICGNVVHAMGEGAFSCCGVALPPLEAETPDEAHGIMIESDGHEMVVTMDHPMEKGHFISFIAYVTDNRCDIRKLYPEDLFLGARFAYSGAGYVFAFCNRHGLFRVAAVRGKNA